VQRETAGISVGDGTRDLDKNVNAAHEGGATIATGGRPGLPDCQVVVVSG